MRASSVGEVIDVAKVLMRCVKCEAGITQNWEGYCGWVDSAPYCWPCFTELGTPERKVGA